MLRQSSLPSLPGWRAGVLVLAAVVAVIFVGSVVGGGRHVKAATTAKWASCSGVGFEPSDSGQSFGIFGSNRTGSGVFNCALDLPHRATITAARFHLFDADPAQNVGCRVHRVRLVNPSGQHDFVSESVATTDVPGFVTLSASSISNAVVDDNRFAYWAGCTLGADTTDLGIVGASIRYVP